MNAFIKRFGAVALILAVLLAASEARADRLRKLKVGDTFPAFTLQNPDGGVISSDDYRGHVLVLVFLSAEQHSSEQAAVDAARVVADVDGDLRLLYVTADVIYSAYFQDFRRKSELTDPLGFDANRELYEKLGLIVLPTTVIVDREGKLAHVIAIHRSDYAQTLDIYALHTLGMIDDKELERQLSARINEVSRPESRASRHRAVARLLREKGLYDNAERELQAALDLAPDDVNIKLDLASLYLAEDKQDDAVGIVDAVLADKPDQRRAKLLHAIILFREDKLDEAEPLFQELLVLNPDPARTHYYLGRIYEAQGQKDKALYHYREALVRFMSDEID